MLQVCRVSLNQQRALRSVRHLAPSARLPQWAHSVNRITMELAKNCNKSPQPASPVPSAEATAFPRAPIQKNLLQSVLASSRTEPRRCRQSRELWSPSRSGCSRLSLEDEVRRLLVHSTALHLSARCGCVADEVERLTVEDIAKPILMIARALRHGCPPSAAALYSTSQRQELRSLLILASIHVSCGVRHWELLRHEETISGIDSVIVGWEGSAMQSQFYQDPNPAGLFGSTLAGQRRLLCLMPLILVQASALSWGGLPHAWDPAALTAVGHVLSLLTEVSQWGDDAERRQRVDRLHIAALSSVGAFSTEPQSPPSSALPPWAAYVLSPLLGHSVVARLSESILEDVGSASAASVGVQRGVVYGHPLLKMTPMMKAVKSIPVLTTASPASGGTTGVATAAPRFVMPLRRALFNGSAEAADGTRLEKSAVVRDVLLSSSALGIRECLAVVMDIAERSRRGNTEDASSVLTVALLRVVTKRIVILVQRQLDASSSQNGRREHPVGASDPSWLEARECFAEAHRIITGTILLLRRDVKETDMVAEYWALARKLL